MIAPLFAEVATDGADEAEDVVDEDDVVGVEVGGVADEEVEGVVERDVESAVDDTSLSAWVLIGAVDPEVTSVSVALLASSDLLEAEVVALE